MDFGSDTKSCSDRAKDKLFSDKERLGGTKYFKSLDQNYISCYNYKKQIYTI